jgi:signal peptidase I
MYKMKKKLKFRKIWIVMAFVAVFLVVYGATVYAVSSGLFKQW